MGEYYFSACRPVLPVYPPTPNEKRKIKRHGYRNATEYLQFVQLEREKCLKTVIPISKEEKQQVDIKVPLQLKKEFLSCLLKVKSQLTSDLSYLQERFPMRNTEHFPKKNDMLGWCAFCLGMESMAQIRKCVPKVKVREYNYEDGGYPPFLRLVLHLSQPSMLKLLGFLGTWLQALGFSTRLGQWMFAMLVVIQKPVHKRRAYATLCEFMEVVINFRRSSAGRKVNACMLDNIIYALKECFHCKEEESGITLRERRFLGVATRRLIESDCDSSEFGDGS